jgi:hypothetical protein
MPRFIHSNVISDVTPAADGIYTYPLPTGALSHLILVIKALNAAAAEATVPNLLALITRIEVLHRGSAIFSASADDAALLSALVTGAFPVSENNVATDNAIRTLPLTIPFSRRMLNPLEGLPARPSGTYTLQLTVDIATAAADGLILQCGAVEMPDAAPTNFLKQTTANYTPAATGEGTLSLGRTSKLAGLLMWATTVPTAIAWTATIDQMSLLANNMESYFSGVYWEQLHAALLARLSASLELVATDTFVNNYGLADLSPNHEDDYLLDTTTLSDLRVRILAGAANATRIIPIEVAPAELLTI